MTRVELKQQEAALHTEVVRLLTETTDSYDSIARITGYSTGRVYGIARVNGLRRRADKGQEVSNG